MQCTSYFPGSYSRQDFNGTVNGGPWLPYANNISPNMSGQSYNYFSLQPNVDQIGVVYHNEMARRMILRHEFVFRDQVQELHRLHRRQREWMDEYMRRRMKEMNIVPMISHYSSILPKISPDHASMTWKTPTGPTLPWINQDANKLSSLGSNSAISTLSFLDLSPQNENCFENNEFTPPKCKKPRLKVLDLELPADNYIDSDEENGNEVRTKTFHCSNDKNVNVMAFDLNMPPTHSLESEILQTNTDLEIATKPLHYANPNNEREEIVIQVYDVESKVSKKYLIDLNYCVDEDEPLPTLPFSKTIVTMNELDLEPVSPENKESSPPRGESEENLLETQVQTSKQDDIFAAETIILMSKSGFNEETLDSDGESLYWFAGIVISSVANNMEDYERGMSSDGTVKKETKCVVALPSQHGKCHQKRMNGKINKKRGDFRPLSSLVNNGLDSGEKGLKNWGKVNKRQRGPRVPVSSIRLLWS